MCTFYLYNNFGKRETVFEGGENAGLENAELELNGPKMKEWKCQNDEMQTLNTTSV